MLILIVLAGLLVVTLACALLYTALFEQGGRNGK